MSRNNETTLVLNERVLSDLADAYNCCVKYVKEHENDEKLSFQYWECLGKIHILERITNDRRTGPTMDVLSKAVIKNKYSTPEEARR